MIYTIEIHTAAALPEVAAARRQLAGLHHRADGTIDVHATCQAHDVAPADIVNRGGPQNSWQSRVKRALARRQIAARKTAGATTAPS